MPRQRSCCQQVWLTTLSACGLDHIQPEAHRAWNASALLGLLHCWPFGRNLGGLAIHPRHEHAVKHTVMSMPLSIPLDTPLKQGQSLVISICGSVYVCMPACAMMCSCGVHIGRGLTLGGPRTVYLFPRRCSHLPRRGWRCQQRRWGKRQQRYLRRSAATCESDGHLANLSAGRRAGRRRPLGRVPATHCGHPADLQAYLTSVAEPPALCRTFGTAASRLPGARRLRHWGGGPQAIHLFPRRARLLRRGWRWQRRQWQRQRRSSLRCGAATAKR